MHVRSEACEVKGLYIYPEWLSNIRIGFDKIRLTGKAAQRPILIKAALLLTENQCQVLMVPD